MIVPGLRKWHVGKHCVFLFTAFHALLLYCLWDVKVGALTPPRLQTGIGQPLRWMFSLKNIFWPRNGPRHWWYTAFLLEKLPVSWEASGQWLIAEFKHAPGCGKRTPKWEGSGAVDGEEGGPQSWWRKEWAWRARKSGGEGWGTTGDSQLLSVPAKLQRGFPTSVQWDFWGVTIRGVSSAWSHGTRVGRRQAVLRRPSRPRKSP